MKTKEIHLYSESDIGGRVEVGIRVTETGKLRESKLHLRISKTKSTAKKPLWREIEDMTPKERMAKLCHVVEIDLDEYDKQIEVAAIIRVDEDNRAFITIPIDESGITQDNFFLTEEWQRVRNSFYQCKEWRAFRLNLIAERGGKCEECNKTAVILQCHHRINIASRVVKEGFLSALEHKEDFSIICMECHVGEHIAIINAMQLPEGEREQSYNENARGEIPPLELIWVTFEGETFEANRFFYSDEAMKEEGSRLATPEEIAKAESDEDLYYRPITNPIFGFTRLTGHEGNSNKTIKNKYSFSLKLTPTKPTNREKAITEAKEIKNPGERAYKLMALERRGWDAFE